MSQVVADRAIASVCCFFFQAEDGIRDLVRSRGLGDVYKRQPVRAIGMRRQELECQGTVTTAGTTLALNPDMRSRIVLQLSLIHI